MAHCSVRDFCKSPANLDLRVPACEMELMLLISPEGCVAMSLTTRV